MMDTGERIWRNAEFGHFLNDGLEGRPVGYRNDLIRYEKTHWWSASVGVYHFQLDQVQPLTYVLGRLPAKLLGIPIGSKLQPCRDGEDNWGSVPIQSLYNDDRFISWLFHDDAYSSGLIWICEPESTLYYKRVVTRYEADYLYCFAGIGAQDGNRLDRNLIFNAVHWFGGGVWEAHGR